MIETRATIASGKTDQGSNTIYIMRQENALVQTSDKAKPEYSLQGKVQARQQKAEEKYNRSRPNCRKSHHSESREECLVGVSLVVGRQVVSEVSSSEKSSSYGNGVVEGKNPSNQKGNSLHSM